MKQKHAHDVPVLCADDRAGDGPSPQPRHDENVAERAHAHGLVSLNIDARMSVSIIGNKGEL